MKPIVEYVEYSGSAWIRLASRLASRFATKVDNEANIFRFDGGSGRLTVRVTARLLDKLLDGGKLYAMESTTKPLFGARFRHHGSWYMPCKKEDWERLCNNARELASAASPEQRASIAGRHVDELIRGDAEDA
jgi:invasion protein IalB